MQFDEKNLGIRQQTLHFKLRRKTKCGVRIDFAPNLALMVNCRNADVLYSIGNIDFSQHAGTEWHWLDGCGNSFSMGLCAEISLAEARIRADRLSYERFGGINGSQTAFAVEALSWLKSKFCQRLSQIRLRRLQIYIENLIQCMGELPVGKVCALEVKKVIAKIRNNSWHQRDCLSVIVQIMDLAVEDGLIERHGLYALKRSLSIPRGVHGRGFKFCRLENLTNVLEKLIDGGFKEQHFHILLLQALLCVRPGECIKIELSWYNPKTGIITFPRSAMKVKDPRLDDFRVPVAVQVHNLLQRCLQLRRGLSKDLQRSVFLFPGKDQHGHLSNDPVSRALKRMDGSINLHGLRKMARTWMAERGIPVEIAAKCLDHELRLGADSFYQRSDLLDKRKAVMQDYADAVEAVLPQKLSYLLN